MVQASYSDALFGAERYSKEWLVFRQLFKGHGVTLELGDKLITSFSLRKGLLKI